MTYKVLFSPLTASQGLDAIQPLLDDDIELLFSEPIPNKADYHVLVSAAPTQNHLTASPNLRKLIYPSVGASANLIRLVSEYPHICLHQVPYSTPAVIETALALLLAVSKFVRRADSDLRKSDWSLRYEGQPQMVLNGRTALIVGYGRVGSGLSTVLQTLGMTVMAIRQRVDLGDEGNGLTAIRSRSELTELLPQVDVLIGTLPNMPEAEGWIGPMEVGLLSKQAIIVNVGNARTFDEASLFAALKNSYIAGAGLDSWYDMPTTSDEQANKRPSRFPFSTLANVVMSPSIAGQLGADDHGRQKMLAEMINKAYRGEKVPYRVHLGLGY